MPTEQPPSSGTPGSDRSLRAIFQRKLATWDAIIREEGGTEWRALILQEVEQKVSRADEMRQVRCLSVVSRVSYVTSTCRNTTRVVIGRETGNFERAINGDGRAAETLLMLFWPQTETAIVRARMEEYDSEILTYLARGFVDAITGKRKRFRARSPEVLPRLVRVICHRGIKTVRRRHGWTKDDGASLLFVPYDDLHLEDPAKAGSEQEKFLLEELLRCALAAELQTMGGGEKREFGSEGVFDFLYGITPCGSSVLQKFLIGALKELPENHRKAVLLRAYHPSWSNTELVEALDPNVNVSTFRSWLGRGRDSLGKKVREFLGSLATEELTDCEEVTQLCRLRRVLGIVVEPAT